MPNVKLKHVAQILDRERLPSTRYIYRLPNGLPAITRHRWARHAAHPAGTNGNGILSMGESDDLHSFDLLSPHLEILKTF